MTPFSPHSLFAFLLLTASASAQWSSDAATNLAVADAVGDQVQAKLIPTADGGCYVSWFDSFGNGFDVRLQRLDAAGNEQWAHNGVLVADRSFSSTQDYGLGIDSTGNALLAFRDDRFVGTQVSAARVTPAGALDWGVNGIQLTSTTDFVGAPKITGTTDGEIVVAWTHDSGTRLQRLDSTGASQWGPDLILTPGAGSYLVSDLHAAGADAIVSMVHQTGNFLSPKHIVAQKLDSAGAALWGVTPLAVFDGGSLQIGNFPTFVPDGSGGAVFGWYSNSPLQVYAQHVLSNGTEAFPHNGSVGSSNASQIRAVPSVDYDAVTGETYLFWEEANAGQSMFGLSGQKFDGSGAPQWGANGETLIPVGPGEVRNVRTVVNGTGTFVFWKEVPSLGQDVIKGRHLDASGATDIATFDVASTPSEKTRMTAILGSTGQALLAWTDALVDAGDIYMQNVNANGSLGGELGTAFCFGVGCPCGNDDANAGCVNSTGVGATVVANGTTSVGTDNLIMTASDLKPNGPSLLFAGTIQVNGGSGLAFGDGLRCAGGTIQRLGVKTSSAGGEATWGPGLVASGSWVNAGDTRTMQVWYRDPSAGPCGGGFNTTHGVELVFTP